MTSSPSGRVRQVLKVVDDLELDGQELLTLRAELETRQECLLDLDACTDPEERRLARAIKDRIDAVTRGEARLVPIGDIVKGARDALAKAQSGRRARGRARP